MRSTLSQANVYNAGRSRKKTGERMSPNENQRWVLRHLSDNGGRWSSGLPSRDNVSPAQMEADIVELHRSRMLAVSGPPNQNAELGVDVRDMSLLSAGRAIR